MSAESSTPTFGDELVDSFADAGVGAVFRFGVLGSDVDAEVDAYDGSDGSVLFSDELSDGGCLACNVGGESLPGLFDVVGDDELEECLACGGDGDGEGAAFCS